MTSLRGSLPKENGLDQLNGLICHDPQRKFLVVAVIEGHKITTDVDTGMQEAQVRLRRIKAITSEDATRAEQLLRRAVEVRTGQTELPIELEDELSEILEHATGINPKDVDPDTGEIRGDW